ncbi:MAG: amidophosphoribosyltransferase [Candidatus Melainabacteria bacterium]|nr:amidophosphoribosyltransferase [Candidatus Melainabacteria bacterium]MBI3307838.1 amidophosphoribosyltransferase [Candidatus Melainabacteria bacterium]
MNIKAVLSDNIIDFDTKPRDACGVFGIVAPGEDVSRVTFFGLYALQHRGQESCGIATFKDKTVSLHKDIGLVSQVFDEKVLSKLKGDIAVGHTRYSTTGATNIQNAQPILVQFEDQKLVIAHNGNLVNATELRNFLIEKGYKFESATDTEVMAKLVAFELSCSKELKIAVEDAFKRCKGAFSVVIATSDYLIAVRDPGGVRPLCLGTTSRGQYVVASESCALDIIGADYVREIAPGEVLLINKEQKLVSNLSSLSFAPHHCIFELIYFSRPDSTFRGLSIYHYRKELGRQLAIESPALADYVITVPDSGTPAAIGYAEELKLPYTEALIKNRYVGRTFIQPSEMLRELGIRLKLNPLKDIIAGKKIVVVDDSIVRGHTSRKIVKLLKDSGAKEVHMRLSSPPIKWPCFYGIDIDSRDQLIAAKKDSVKEITKFIGADTLEYLSHDGMIKATGLSRNFFCTACFSGEYPIKIPKELEGAKFRYEKYAKVVSR